MARARTRPHCDDEVVGGSVDRPSTGASPTRQYPTSPTPTAATASPLHPARPSRAGSCRCTPGPPRTPSPRAVARLADSIPACARVDLSSDRRRPHRDPRRHPLRRPALGSPAGICFPRPAPPAHLTGGCGGGQLLSTCTRPSASSTSSSVTKKTLPVQAQPLPVFQAAVSRFSQVPVAEAQSSPTRSTTWKTVTCRP